MPNRIDIEGADEVQRILEQMQDDQLADDALWAGAEVVRKQAQAEAPSVTGALKSSIYAATMRQSGYRRAAATAKALSGVKEMQPEEKPYSKNRALVAVAVPYGRLIEYRSDAFLRPALSKSKQKIVEAMLKVIKDDVKELD